MHVTEYLNANFIQSRLCISRNINFFLFDSVSGVLPGVLYHCGQDYWHWLRRYQCIWVWDFFFLISWMRIVLWLEIQIQHKGVSCLVFEIHGLQHCLDMTYILNVFLTSLLRLTPVVKLCSCDLIFEIFWMYAFAF